jgi:hypothetical protein
MRSRQRLIEVLNSVNRQAVHWSEFEACVQMRRRLQGQPGVFYFVNETLNHHPDFSSTHIRELLQEGLAILAADKLTGCSAS